MFKVLSILLAASLSLNVQTTQADSGFNLIEINKTLAEVVKTVGLLYQENTGKKLKATLAVGDQTSGEPDNIKALHLQIALENLKATWSKKPWGFELNTLLRLATADNVEVDVNLTAKTETLALLRWSFGEPEWICSRLPQDELSQMKMKCDVFKALGTATSLDKVQELFETILEKTKTDIAQQIAGTSQNSKKLKELLNFLNRWSIETLETGGFTIAIQGHADKSACVHDVTETLGALCILGEIRLSIKESAVVLSIQRLDIGIEDIEHYEDIKESVSDILAGLEVGDEESKDLTTSSFYWLLMTLDGDL